MALDTTIGGASANSYADTTFATAYFTALGLTAEWSTYGSEAMLLRAMDAIEVRDYLGGRANNDATDEVYQALEFPRKATFHAGRNTSTDGTSWTDRRGRIWTNEENPTPIKQAQCWEAMAAGLDDYRLANEPDEVTEIRTGRVTLKMGASDFTQKIKRARMEAERLLRPFLASENGRTSRT